MSKEIITIAGTGHRPDKLGGYFAPVEEELTRFLYRYIRDSYPECQRIISGMALGFDQALAKAAINLDLQLVAAVPFKGQEDNWSPAYQTHYNWLLSRAKEVVYVSLPGFEIWKMQKRNEWMINNCDLLLALWNGSPGGTANCLGYARGKKPVTNLWSAWKSTT